MKINTIYPLILLMSFIISAPALSKKLSANKIITDIESDKLQLNKKTLTSIFTGNVYLTRNQLTISANKIIVVQFKNKENKTKIKYIEAYGNPTTLTDVNEDGEQIKAVASKIFYNQNTQRIKLIGNAKLTTEEDQFSSQVIWYNKETKEVKAGKIKEETKNKTSRVKIIFSENDDEQAK